MDLLSRMTPATRDVLGALLDGAEPIWGLLVVKQTGRPAGSVYPILERLEAAGWVTSAWEADAGRSGARRRLYELTSSGAEAARAAVAAAAAAARATARPRAVRAITSTPGVVGGVA